MKISSIPLVLIGTFALGTSLPAATAQSNEKPYRLADFTEQFEDADGTTVTAFAKSEGIGFDEAKRRLVSINRLN